VIAELLSRLPFDAVIITILVAMYVKVRDIDRRVARMEARVENMMRDVYYVRGKVNAMERAQRG